MIEQTPENPGFAAERKPHVFELVRDVAGLLAMGAAVEPPPFRYMMVPSALVAGLFHIANHRHQAEITSNPEQI